MTPVLDITPTVDQLAYLAPGILSQRGNLAKAIRLWVILQSLYGEDATWRENYWFTSAHWRNVCYPEGLPDEATIQDWLMGAAMDLSTWSIDYCQRYPDEQDKLPERLREIPFEISDRTLRNDFATLANLNWLETDGERKQRVYRQATVLPKLQTLSVDDTTITTSQLIPNDLTVVADQFFSPINGEQRFILDIENVIHTALSQHLRSLLEQLKQAWQAPITQPFQLTYRSARYYQNEFDLIIYPVCIYYCQRAPYLFAYGQTPNTMSAQQPEELAWYDYRLDHILASQPMTWADPSIPQPWRRPADTNQAVPKTFQGKSPQYVYEEVSRALGFEIYRPAEIALLRFDRYFYANYIAGTEREKLFTQISYEQAQRLFNADRAVVGQALNLKLLMQSRTSQQQDVFCTVRHRVDDNNVVMRMRAWGGNVEVLLPLSLRQRMQADLTKALSSYGVL